MSVLVPCRKRVRLEHVQGSGSLGIRAFAPGGGRCQHPTHQMTGSLPFCMPQFPHLRKGDNTRDVPDIPNLPQLWERFRSKHFNATSGAPGAPVSRMSQLSSPLKRYGDTSRYPASSYSKSPTSYGSYSSYGSSFVASYPDKDKVSFKPSPPSSYLPSSRLRTSSTSPTSSYDAGRLALCPESSIRLSPAYGRMLARPLGSGGLSGGACYAYTSPTSSPTSYMATPSTLSRKKSSSHSDLAREFAGLHTSEPYRLDSPTHTPLLARNRQELCALQSLYQAASRSDYVKEYLESCSRKGNRTPGCSRSPTQEVLTPMLRPNSRCPSQPWERSESRTDSPARDPSLGGSNPSPSAAARGGISSPDAASLCHGSNPFIIPPVAGLCCQFLGVREA
ncbi:Ubiquitin carboxyl-terminal hydrolase 2 [Chelonia mydas]|uniref:Ubiquitin carboxyl-terminal hydrolase 2 n=1 Tax=Chelonia mydas TaxID=8469 RepID=M7AW97_CHEMY|nr:Ubiquitin carboxyl-terminal hydrolase 2 [Chelonia mydas]